MKLCHKLLLVSACSLATFLFWQNNGITLSKHTYVGDVPKSFDGFKIMQVSDLQNKSFGKNQSRILHEIQLATPNIIVITGDLLDRNRTDLDTAMEFIRGATKIAPVYFVSGNHDHQSGEWDTLVERLTAENVVVLDNGKSILARNSDTITMLGIADKSVNPYYTNALRTLMHGEEDNFTILLSHRPELFDTYAEYPIDLVFTGHAHGGQIRLPFIGPLFAPHQGFFPKLTSGAYTQRYTTMYVSRGLGNSTFPFRIFNRPELLEVTLRSK